MNTTTQHYTTSKQLRAAANARMAEIAQRAVVASKPNTDRLGSSLVAALRAALGAKS